MGALIFVPVTLASLWFVICLVAPVPGFSR